MIATGLTVSVLLGVVVMPAVLDPGSSTVAAGGARSSASGLRLLDWRKAKSDFVPRPDCLGKPVDRCTVVRGTGRRVVLMGDSDAWMWIPAFRAIARRRNWNLSVLTFPTCPWQRDLQGLVPERFACADHQADWYSRVIPALDPDLLVLAHQAFDDPRRPLAFVGPGGTAAFARSPRVEPLLIGAASAALEQLERPGRDVVILEPIPDPPPDFDPLACLSTGTPVHECSYTAQRGVTPLVAFYRRQAAVSTNRVATVDLARVVCPRFPTCDAVVDDVIVKRDRNHLTETFARSATPRVTALLDRSGMGRGG